MTTEEKVREVVVFYDLCRLTTDEATSKLMSIIEEEKSASYVEGAKDGEKLANIINKHQPKAAS